MGVAEVLGEALEQLWPKRRAQEALLDLGENKPWQPTDRQRVVQEVAAWLVEAGVLPSDVQAAPAPSLSITEIRQRAAASAPATAEGPPGVAIDLAKLAPALGSSAKTLANSLSLGLNVARPDHRWLLALARLDDARLARLPFHRRSHAAMGTLLARLAAHVAVAQPDAADALLVFSALALWQRRRRTTEGRASRGRSLRRREVAMPIAGLAHGLITQGAFEALVCWQHSAAVLLAFEAGVTVAHLEPRVPRRTSPLAGTVWWPANLRRHLARLIPEDERWHFEHRLGIMEAWRQHTPWPEPPAPIAGHSYVRFAAALASLRTGRPLAPDLAAVVADDWEGRAMLAPMIRERVGK